jgi:hypothetical protein
MDPCFGNIPQLTVEEWTRASIAYHSRTVPAHRVVAAPQQERPPAGLPPTLSEPGLGGGCHDYDDD